MVDKGHVELVTPQILTLVHFMMRMTFQLEERQKNKMLLTQDDEDKPRT